MARRKPQRTWDFWRGKRGGSFGIAPVDSTLPAYSPLSIAPPLSRAKRRSAWPIIVGLLALGTAFGIAWSR
jgi:hypothetical protein